MLKYLMKNLPAKYIYAGYCIRKGFTIMTSQENGKIVYDTFLFTYVDNFLSFFLKMDNGKYKVSIIILKYLKLLQKIWLVGI